MTEMSVELICNSQIPTSPELILRTWTKGWLVTVQLAMVDPAVHHGIFHSTCMFNQVMIATPDCPDLCVI